jgi:hypothetical protein
MNTSGTLHPRWSWIVWEQNVPLPLLFFIKRLSDHDRLTESRSGYNYTDKKALTFIVYIWYFTRDIQNFLS